MRHNRSKFDSEKNYSPINRNKMKNLKSSKVRELSLNEKQSIEGGGGFEDFLTAVADAVREYVYEKTGYCME